MGNAKLPLIFNTLANFLNIVLNFLLIYPTREIWGRSPFAVSSRSLP